VKNEEPRDLDRLLGGFEPPPLPSDLRALTLRAARERLAEAPAPDLWSRIWDNRGVRLAWTAAVVLLLAGHVLVSSKLDPAVTTRPPVLAGDAPDERFLEILRPVEINADAHPSMGLFADAADLNQIEYGGNPS
jgi:hypothetical protein